MAGATPSSMPARCGRVAGVDARRPTPETRAPGRARPRRRAAAGPSGTCPTRSPAAPGWPSYDTSTAGVVVDRVTHLMWQRQVPADAHDWDQAGAYCACLQLAGHDDWRLPTRIELVSLVDYTRSFPAIDAQAFPDTPVRMVLDVDRCGPTTRRPPGSCTSRTATPTTTRRTSRRTGCAACATPMRPRRRSLATSRADGGVLDQRTGLTWQRAGGRPAAHLGGGQGPLPGDGRRRRRLAPAQHEGAADPGRRQPRRTVHRPDVRRHARWSRSGPPAP